MLGALGIDPEAAARDWPHDAGEALSALNAGHSFTVPEVLFRKITDEDRTALEARFDGAAAEGSV
jgi:methionyl-tRNA synthetase